MLIELVEIQWKDDDGMECTNLFHYKPLEYCCETLKDNPVIVFSETDTELPQFCIVQQEVIYSYEDEFNNDIYYPIQFCPFCGQKIDVKVVETKDVSIQYQTMVKERKKMRYLYTKTDSIKKADMISEKLRVLNQKLNYFYAMVEYSEDNFSNIC